MLFGLLSRGAETFRTASHALSDGTHIGRSGRRLRAERPDLGSLEDDRRGAASRAERRLGARLSRARTIGDPRHAPSRQRPGQYVQPVAQRCLVLEVSSGRRQGGWFLGSASRRCAWQGGLALCAKAVGMQFPQVVGAAARSHSL